MSRNILFSQYLIIETSVGGLGCTDKQFIRGCLNFILPQAKHHHLYRQSRHSFIRDALNYLHKAQDLAFSERLRDSEYIEDMYNRNIVPCEGELKQAWHLHEMSKGCLCQ